MHLSQRDSSLEILGKVLAPNGQRGVAIVDTNVVQPDAPYSLKEGHPCAEVLWDAASSHVSRLRAFTGMQSHATSAARPQYSC